VLVDEVQDLPLLAVQLCALLGGTGPAGLVLVGDGQPVSCCGCHDLRSRSPKSAARAAAALVGADGPSPAWNAPSPSAA